VSSDVSFRFGGADQFCDSLTSTSVLTRRFFRIVGRFYDDIFSDLNSPTGLNKVWTLHPRLFRDSTSIARYQLPSGYVRIRSSSYKLFEEGSRRFNERSDTKGMISFQKRWSNACSFLVPCLRSWKYIPLYSATLVSFVSRSLV
jgi:hypothetical protein